MAHPLRLLLPLLLLPAVVVAQDKTTPEANTRTDLALADYWGKVEHDPEREESARSSLLMELVQAGGSCLPRLRVLLQSRQTITVREPILRKLPEISPGKWESFLFGLLKPDTHLSLKRQALRVLSDLATPGAVPGLFEVLSHERADVRYGGADALVGVATRHPLQRETLRYKLADLLTEAKTGQGDLQRAGPALTALVKLDGLQALPIVVACMKAKGVVLRAALGQLPHIPKPMSWREKLRRTLPTTPQDVLLQLLKRHPTLNTSELMMVLQGFRYWGTYDAIPPLIAYMEAEPDRLSRQALYALQSLTGVERDSVAGWAAWWASVEPIWSSYPDLIEEIEGGAGVQRTLEILALIEQIRDPRTVEVIRYLFDRLVAPAMNKLELRAAKRCCEVLARYGHKSAALPLIELLEGSLPKTLEETVVWALSILARRSGPPDAKYWRGALFPKSRRYGGGGGGTSAFGSGLVAGVVAAAPKRVPSQGVSKAQQIQLEQLKAEKSQRRLLLGGGFLLLLFLFGALVAWGSRFEDTSTTVLIEMGRYEESEEAGHATSDEWAKGLEARTSKMKRVFALNDGTTGTAEASPKSSPLLPKKKESAWTLKLKRISQGGGLQMHLAGSEDEPVDEERGPKRPVWEEDPGTAMWQNLSATGVGDSKTAVWNEPDAEGVEPSTAVWNEPDAQGVELKTAVVNPEGVEPSTAVWNEPDAEGVEPKTAVVNPEGVEQKTAVVTPEGVEPDAEGKTAVVTPTGVEPDAEGKTAVVNQPDLDEPSTAVWRGTAGVVQKTAVVNQPDTDEEPSTAVWRGTAGIEPKTAVVNQPNSAEPSTAVWNGGKTSEGSRTARFKLLKDEWGRSQ